MLSWTFVLHWPRRLNRTGSFATPNVLLAASRCMSKKGQSYLSGRESSLHVDQQHQGQHRSPMTCGLAWKLPPWPLHHLHRVLQNESGSGACGPSLSGLVMSHVSRGACPSMSHACTGGQSFGLETMISCAAACSGNAQRHISVDPWEMAGTKCWSLCKGCAVERQQPAGSMR